jgi:pimeloyl-ACP methyl ester carboxylesterase
MVAYAEQSGDAKYLQSLLKQGPPPYGGKNPIVPYANLLSREYQVFESRATSNEVYQRDGDLLLLMLKQPEYGWLDRVRNLLGLKNTFNVVYPQLQTLDLRQDASKLDLPVYLICGRNDTNAPTALTEDYFSKLQAPDKQLIYFEDSGHGMIWQEADRFREVLVQQVLAETYGRSSLPGSY